MAFLFRRSTVAAAGTSLLVVLRDSIHGDVTLSGGRTGVAARTSFCDNHLDKSKNVHRPVVLSTWDFGLLANQAAWTVLSTKGMGGGGSALDAVEQGVRITEADPSERSVGRGGRPDREGKVTLDACIMDHNFNIGSVACMENVVHAVSVARAVMEKSPHAMLVGEGAMQFALKHGFERENLLTKESEKEWREWLVTSKYRPIVNIENHDTIGMIAIDAHGNLAGTNA
jgi:N4-(beta-N-acetylglucosaminyl)-L-asparaginase